MTSLHLKSTSFSQQLGCSESKTRENQMKVVVALILGLCMSNAFAKDDYQSQAEAKFNAMSAQEAYTSSFKQRTMSVQMPGTSTWVNGREVCIAGNSVRTINPVSYCVQWTGKDKDGDVRTFDNYLDAKNILKGNVADKCSGKIHNILSTSINYTATKCTLWSAKGGDDDNWETKYFSSKSKAEDYGNDVSCAKNETYTATYPTTFKVEFFRNEVENNRYLGSHTYAVARCGGGTTPDVEAF